MTYRHSESSSHERLGPALLLPFLEDLARNLGTLDPGNCHSSEGWTHTIGSPNLCELHSTNNQTRNNLAGALDDGVLGEVHIETTHATKSAEGIHANKTLGTERTKGTVMTSSGDDDRGVDSVRVCNLYTLVYVAQRRIYTRRLLLTHATLVVVVHRD